MSTVGLVTGAGRGMGFACARRLTTMVDRLLLVDLEAGSAGTAATRLSVAGGHAVVEPFVLDVTDGDGLRRLADRARALGTLRAVVHAAGISPTMADWRRILTVDLVGTALLVDTLKPLATAGTAFVCFASMAPHLGLGDDQPATDAVLDTPLEGNLPERIHEVLGAAIEDSGVAYMWAKRGVHRLVRREAVALGSAGSRICSVSPGLIDTPMNEQEMATQPSMAMLRDHTPLDRLGRADDVAAVVAFLVSDDAGFVTGTDVLVDGGVCAAIKTLMAGTAGGNTARPEAD
jgi:NAD(P)-dependent dehydrogenase (short-subunit alcohol dehydrogenase family)